MPPRREGAVIKTKDIKELLGIVEVGQIAQFLDFLVGKGCQRGNYIFKFIIRKWSRFAGVYKDFSFLFKRQALLLKIDSEFLNLQNSGMSAQELEKMKTQTSSLSQKDLQNILELFIDAENKIKYSAISQLPLELAILNITYPQG